MQEKTLEGLGGKIHTILNETVIRALTIQEYTKLVKLIGEALEKAREEGRKEYSVKELDKIQNNAITQYKEELLRKIDEYDRLPPLLMKGTITISEVKKLL